LISFPDVLYNFLKRDGLPFFPVPECYYQLHPIKQKWEKRIARYLIWQARIQAAKSKKQSIKVKTILNNIHIAPDFRNPLKQSERLETALENLVNNGILKEYIKHYHIISKKDTISKNLDAESNYPVFKGKNGWCKEWPDCTISFTCSDDLTKKAKAIKKKYNQIIGKKKARKTIRKKYNGTKKNDNKT
jgi:hypothetical protein